MAKRRKRTTIQSHSDELARSLDVALEYLRTKNPADAQRVRLALTRTNPGSADAWFFCGSSALQNHANDVAAKLLEHALRLGAQRASCQCNLGEAYRRLGRLHDAVTALERAVTLEPALGEAHFNLALVLQQLGRLDDAADAYARATELTPTLVTAAIRLVNLLRECRRHDRAIAAFSHLSPRFPDSAELLCAGANAMADVYRLDEALTLLARALELTPNAAHIHASHAHALADLGRVEEALAHLRTAIRLDPDCHPYHSNLVYLLAYSPETDAQSILQEARDYGRRCSIEHVGECAFLNTRDQNRRLRIGYVSADFRQHAESHFTIPLFRNHDRSSFEVFCYADVPQPDDVTATIRSLVDVWCDIGAVEDARVASRIRKDKIDVLVDLAMHTAPNRARVFARRAAPVQACWLAYPGTTGLPNMDYRLTDPQLDPPGQYDSDYSECSIRLPESFWCYEPLATMPVGQLPALVAGHFTFGCLNNFRKVTEPALLLWASVLRRLPESRLRLVAPVGETRGRVRRTFTRAGIDPSRLEFVDYSPRDRYLEEYHRIDCCLDTVPCHGGTTSLDAFWMGVPVVSLLGATVAGRSGETLAANLGLAHLVTRTPEEFVSRACALASNLEALAELRRALRARMERSALMDAPRFTRHVETSYREMWSRWCTQAPSNR